MELVPKFVVWFTILTLPLLFLLLRRKKNSGGRKLPPGPPGWPIIGNILDLGTLPHRTLNQLRDKYGGVIWLKLGSVNCMAIVSAKAATEFFKNHDLAFADRYILTNMRVHGYAQGSMGLAPYGPSWRVLRRLVTEEMMVTKRINETAPIRRKCVDDMVKWIEEEAERVKREHKQNCGIGIAHFVGLSMFNLIGNLVMSRDLLDPQSKVGPEFLAAIEGTVEWGSRANLADFFPWLRRFDLQGLGWRMERDLGKALEIVSRFVKERREEQPATSGGASGRRTDFLDVMLGFEGSGNEEPEKFSDNEVNISILEMFIGGSETTSVSIEWAMTELLRNSESMSKVKAELHQIIGPNRKLEESDVEHLSYLQAVVKESLRLHPPAPLLVPRSSIRDTKYMGYDIPKNTQVFVDAWAIGRDPEMWEDPLSFKPERFLGSKLDYKGHHYMFIPFGAGRRICAGIPLAHRLLHLILGTLLHQFDWELGGSVISETLDMNDKLGMAARKLKPLLVVPKKCMF